jgi:ribosomal protein S18 acetylase RimI-like enzyme
MHPHSNDPADSDRPESPTSLRHGDPSDAAVVAKMHVRCITEGFLSRLGPRFLTRLYGRVCRSDGSFLLVAVPREPTARSTVAGFIAGSVSVRRLYGDFLRHDAPAAAASAPWRLARAWPRALETLRHGRSSSPMPSGGELLAIAVDPAWRGSGVGRQLVDGFVAELEGRAVHDAHVVVGADNAAARALYRGAGFAESRTLELHKGTSSVLMQRPPRGSGPAEGQSA